METGHCEPHLNPVELRALEDLTLVGSVRGSEWDAARVKEATLCILQAYCNTLAVNPTIPYPTQLNSTQLNSVQPNPTQPNSTQFSPTQPNPTKPNQT
ncbi:hypothetical protein E2C01_072150 [Portunus trituberculatus]|uniref:Uncharacterized protein n=1 Tax=Portunus trituberculatus TaxID=210409 RepID=A0A5B7I9Y7_PORTR|nr:hypothetical protein [Portunus trituberculatus]